MLVPCKLMKIYCKDVHSSLQRHLRGELQQFSLTLGSVTQISQGETVGGIKILDYLTLDIEKMTH